MQELPLQLANTTPSRVWDLYVPIISNKNTNHVYLTDGIDEPSFYNELCHILYTADESDTFYSPHQYSWRYARHSFHASRRYAQQPCSHHRPSYRHRSICRRSSSLSPATNLSAATTYLGCLTTTPL